MKRFFFFAVFAFSAAFPLAAQQSYPSYRPRSSTPQQPARDATAYFEELAGQVNVKLNQVQDENAMLETKILELEQQVRDMAEINQRLAGQVSELEKRLAASESAYDGQIRKILAQIEKIDSRPLPPPPPPASSGGRGSAASSQDSFSGEYEVYEVQAGATLSVISQAYGVPVREIKRANNLKSDNIYVGQKLKIPVSR